MIHNRVTGAYIPPVHQVKSTSRLRVKTVLVDVRNQRAAGEPCQTEVRGSGENGAGHRPRGGRSDRRPVCGGTTGQRRFRGRATGVTAETVGRNPGGAASQAADLERTVATEASYGRRGGLHARPMGSTDGVHNRWRRAYR